MSSSLPTNVPASSRSRSRFCGGVPSQRARGDILQVILLWRYDDPASEVYAMKLSEVSGFLPHSLM